MKVLESFKKGQTAKELLAEVAYWILSGHHLLVYEFVERGSLDCWLFGNTTIGEEDHLLD